jgi:hypothetical protein
MNKFYAFGVQNLQCYGFLNDPSLPPSLAPTQTWSLPATTGIQIYEDVNRMFIDIQNRLPDLVDHDADMTLAMSSKVYPVLTKPMQNVFGETNNLKKYLSDIFPNLKFKTATEYSTTSGELVQLIVHEVGGQKTSHCAFAEKMRAHAIVRYTSATEQKKSATTWGGLLKMPAAISSMIGV